VFPPSFTASCWKLAGVISRRNNLVIRTKGCVFKLSPSPSCRIVRIVPAGGQNGGVCHRNTRLRMPDGGECSRRLESPLGTTFPTRSFRTGSRARILPHPYGVHTIFRLCFIGKPWEVLYGCCSLQQKPSPFPHHHRPAWRVLCALCWSINVRPKEWVRQNERIGFDSSKYFNFVGLLNDLHYLGMLAITIDQDLVRCNLSNGLFSKTKKKPGGDPHDAEDVCVPGSARARVCLLRAANRLCSIPGKPHRSR